MPSETKGWLTFQELVEACGGKQGAIISDGGYYDGDGAEFDPYEDDDADCFCD